MHVYNTTNSLKYKRRRVGRQGKDPKNKEKKNWKNFVRMVAPVYTFEFWPQNIAGRISEAAMGGTGGRDFMYFLGSNKKQWSCDGRGGGARSAPFGVAMSSKRRVRAAHGRARGAKTH
jgi:hypothetical protein